MDRSYVSVQDIKDTLGITASSDDVLLRKIGEASTKMVENFTGRKFNVEHGTKYFAGADRIWFSPDLLSVSTVKLDEDANASFEATLTTSDYVLFPLNEYPKSYMEVADTSDYGTFAYGVKKGVEITGEWGYGDGESEQRDEMLEPRLSAHIERARLRTASPLLPEAAKIGTGSPPSHAEIHDVRYF